MAKELQILFLGICASVLLAGANAEDELTAPYLVSLRYKHNASSSFLHRCTGVIYSENIVLTAARCIIGIESEKLQVVAGINYRTDSDGYASLVKSYIVHPDFSIFFIDFDLAILKLASSLPTSEPKVARTIGLANKVPEGESATVASWGLAPSDGEEAVPLHDVDVQVFTDAECKGVYGADRITTAMFCASSANTTSTIVDSCEGDGGSALISNDAAVGLVSWASFCGRKGHPNVYINLVTLKPWVESEVTESKSSIISRIFSTIKSLF